MKIFIPDEYSYTSLVKHFSNTSITLTTDKTSHVDFALCVYEPQISEVESFCRNTRSPMPRLDLLHKDIFLHTCKDAGIPILEQYSINSADSLDELNIYPFILKPGIGLGTYSTNPLAYKIYQSKQEFLTAVANNLPNFWDIQTTTDRLYLQKAVVDTNGMSILLPISVYINGKGIPIITNYHQCWQKLGNNSGSSADITTDTIAEMLSESDKAYIEDAVNKFVAQAHLQNCFCFIQFIQKRGDTWYPLDFSYRLNYAQTFLMPDVDLEYCNDLMKYTYDLVPEIAVKEYYPHLRLLTIDINKQNLKSITDTCKVQLLFSDSSIEYNIPETTTGTTAEPKTFLAMCYGSTPLVAKNTMDQYMQQVGATQ